MEYYNFAHQAIQLAESTQDREISLLTRCNPIIDNKLDQVQQTLNNVQTTNTLNHQQLSKKVDDSANL